MADGQTLPLYEGGRRLFDNERVVVYADVFEPGRPWARTGTSGTTWSSAWTRGI